MALRLALIACIALPLVAAEDDGALLIAPRKNRIWFAPGIKEDAFQREAAEASRLLVQNRMESEALAELVEGLKRDKNRTAKIFGAYLDARKTTDTTVRLGALKAIELAEPEPAAIGKVLGSTAIMEKDKDVRAAAIELIRARKDPEASRAMIKSWHASFEDKAMGVHEALRTAAEDAMRDVGDRRVYEVLYTYVTMEVRAQQAQLDRTDTVRIRNAGQNVQTDDRAGNINLPIELPSITLMSTEGTVIVPALPSLKRITGQNFGWDMKRWKTWIDAQPEFKK